MRWDLELSQINSAQLPIAPNQVRNGSYKFHRDSGVEWSVEEQNCDGRIDLCNEAYVKVALCSFVAFLRFCGFYRIGSLLNPSIFFERMFASVLKYRFNLMEWFFQIEGKRHNL